MPKISATMKISRFDANSLTKKTAEQLKKHMRAAAKEYLKAAVAAVPIHTGFASYAYANLEEVVGPVNRNLSFTDKFKQRKVKSSRTIVAARLKSNTPEYYYPVPGSKRRYLKTADNSKLFATKPENIFIDPDIDFNVKKGLSRRVLFKFTYEINIRYFNLMDEGTTRSNTNGPWHSTIEGRKAMQNYLRNIKFKDITKFFIQAKATVKDRIYTRLNFSSSIPLT